jgi:rfaE bifunctional protein kinase chain/domain
MMSHSIEDIFRSFQKLRIAVVGDIMLDKYIFGHVSRISPEYPVPVVDVTHESSRLGGAANVALNTHALGAETLLIGVTGSDPDREILTGLMTERGLSTGTVITDSYRPTTCKTRILSQNHHITRVDYESRKPIDSAVEHSIVRLFMERVSTLDAVVLEDYNKGVLTESLITAIISISRKHNVPVLVDPKLKGFFSYQGCSVFKPNLSEMAASLGIVVNNNDPEVEQACSMLKQRLQTDNLVVTRSDKGMTIFNERVIHIAAASLEVADVSGAGDTVIGMLALGTAAGLDIETSTKIANLAAGTVCQEVGAAPVNPEKLFRACQTYLR